MKHIARTFGLHTVEQQARFFGWFLVSASTIGIFTTISSNTVLGGMFGITLGMGMWLLLRTIVLTDMSDSTRQLMDEARAGHAKHAGHVHNKKAVEQREPLHHLHSVLLFLGGSCIALVPAWYIQTTVVDPVWRIVPFLFVLCLAMVYGIAEKCNWALYLAFFTSFVILISAGAPLYAISATLVLTALGAWISFKQKNWTLLLLVEMLSFGTILSWIGYYAKDGFLSSLFPASAWSVERLALLVGTVLFFFLFTVPFIPRRRALEEQGYAKAAIFLAALGYFLSMGWLNEYLGGYQWFMALFSLFSICASFGYLAWMQHGRLSNAKYFLTVGLLALVLVCFMYVAPTVLSLLWLVLSIMVMSAGFSLGSYSARLVGLGLVGLTVVHYLLVVLGIESSFAGPFWLHDRVWVGVILGIYLMVLGFWYREGTFRGQEHVLQPVVVQSLVASGGIVAFSAFTIELSGAPESLGWIAVALVWFAVGSRIRNQLAVALGLGLLVTAMTKFFLIDALAFSKGWQYVSLALLGIFLISLASLSTRYRRYQRIYRNWNS